MIFEPSFHCASIFYSKAQHPRVGEYERKRTEEKEHTWAKENCPFSIAVLVCFVRHKKM
jgi:hypothetical protein